MARKSATKSKQDRTPVAMHLTMTFAESQLPDHPSVRGAFNIYAGPRSFPDSTLRDRIAYGQKMFALFPDADPDFVAAAMLNEYFCQDSPDIPIPEGTHKHVAEIQNVIFNGLNNLSSQDMRRYRMLSNIEFAEIIYGRIEEALQQKGWPFDYLNQNKFVQRLEHDLPFILGKTGSPETESQLEALVLKTRTLLDTRKPDVPPELVSFSQSGLPKDPLIEQAYNLMIEMGLKSINSSIIPPCMASIRFARQIVEDGWSSDPEAVALALLKHARSANFHKTRVFKERLDPDFFAKLEVLNQYNPGLVRDEPVSENIRIVFTADTLLSLEAMIPTMEQYKTRDVRSVYAGKDEIKTMNYFDDQERFESAYSTLNAIRQNPPGLENPQSLLPRMDIALAQASKERVRLRGIEAKLDRPSNNHDYGGYTT